VAQDPCAAVNGAQLHISLTTGEATRQRSGMRWRDRLGDVLDDLEQQAEGLALAARDVEVAEQSRAEYAHVDLSARLHGSLGRRLRLAVRGVAPLEGALSGVGVGWVLLDMGAAEWVVPLAAVVSWRGLADRGVPAETRPITARLGLASALRRVAEERDEVLLHCVDGSLTRGVVTRVGADFVELRVRDTEVVPFAALAAVRSR
jgi:hypothetical protein